jgi:hypothetical protein
MKNLFIFTLLLTLSGQALGRMTESQKFVECNSSKKVHMLAEAVKIHIETENKHLEKRIAMLPEKSPERFKLKEKMKLRDYSFSEDNCYGRAVMKFYAQQKRVTRNKCSKASAIPNAKYLQYTLKLLGYPDAKSVDEAVDKILIHIMQTEFNGSSCSKKYRDKIVMYLNQAINWEFDDDVICEKVILYLNRLKDKSSDC